MAVMPHMDVIGEVRIEYVAPRVAYTYEDKREGGLLSAACFPGLTYEEVEALPRALYLSGLAGTLSVNELIKWKQQCEGERIDEAIEEWRIAKLAATPEPDPLDRLFELRTA